jgi:S-adenosylmethionine:tRNA ribosyltransferase-isomerase
MFLSDFNYQLPDELVAQYPSTNRRDSRLLVLGKEIVDTQFSRLPKLINAGDLLIFNDTRVIRARLRGRKETGGRAEILVERVLAENEALSQVRASKTPKPGSRIELPGDATAIVIKRDNDMFVLRFSSPLEPYLEQFGEMPLPPYLGRDEDSADSDRYQTVYARHAGAVAAPTAGLHFDESMLRETIAAGAEHAWITLHVGAGTFQSLREERVAANKLHSERVQVGSDVCAAIRKTRSNGGRVIAVGTTSVRALEAASADGEVRPYNGETEIFITPGYQFRSVDALLTNFHLPQSSLLMLVAAFAGRERVLAAYRHAVREQYRFFSYGDAMLLFPEPR